MGTEKPTLSVLIPNHNHGCHLADCLESLLKQSRPPDEIIVVDDASTDDSWEIATRLVATEARIRLFRNPRRLGVMGTLNRAQQEARGDYVYGGAADDRVLPGMFARAMELFERFPQTGVCFGHTLTLNPQNGHVSEHPLNLADEPRYFRPHELAVAMARQAAPGSSVAIPGNAAIWKRSAHLYCGGYREELKWHADWFALQVIGLRHGACYVPEPLAINRVDRASYSLAGQECWESQQVVLESLLKLLTGEVFRDVWPLFCAGKLLSQFSPWVARVVAGNEEHWTKSHVLLVEDSLRHFHRALLEDGNPVVRRGAAVCLGLLGASAVDATAALESAEHDRHPAVRSAAKEAGVRIRAESPWLARARHRVAGKARQAGRRMAQRMKRVLRPVASLLSAGTDRRVMLRMSVLESQNRRLTAGVQAELQALRQEVGELLSRRSAGRLDDRYFVESESASAGKPEGKSGPLRGSETANDASTAQEPRPKAA